MEVVDTGFDYVVIALANLVIGTGLIAFGLAMALAARAGRALSATDPAAVRFRWAMGHWGIALGAFFSWIMLAWAGLIPYSTRVQAVTLVGCAALTVRLAWCAWRVTRP